ncbi:Acyl-protein synthetase [Mycobacteroides abscessus]|uniref:LuxE/PaaK family acyltransferase n=2 Tax=Mycobacteroides abscessus TaxID=36809 RepID=UPI0005E6632B|nr:acyl-protein synthetase [Mycobacteroides abscessus]CPU20213.1 Acyl-protein synthetase [Mycobacteroides abscessus]CPX22187.1 Acyl-protein synthetase [Mycobacteroides abscessus]CPZ31316.1 Acyl-protein synthetase [Mycobacteroides abscessus]
MDLVTMLGMPGEALRVTREEWRRSLTDVLRESFALHFERNGFYRAQCDAAGLIPSGIRDGADLHRIPLLPVSMFKQAGAHVLMTCGLEDVEIEIRSTGTSGVPSVARRDSTTVTRASVGIFGGYRDFLGISQGTGLFLCPSTAEVPEMGMVKIFNLLTGMLDDHRYVVREYSFDPDEALAHLRNWEGKMTRHLIGPPFIIARFMKYLELEEIPLTLDPDSLIIMLGGWKQYTGNSISRDDFDEKAQRLLGIDPTRIRDMYGMIESNMLAIECEHQRKHVPPWCYISIRDVTDASVELEPGKTGGIAILDALNTAYPGFLLSDDIGEVDESDCPCGRTGQTVKFRRRRQGAELGCCAVSIEKYIDSQEVVAECELVPAGATPGATG